MYTLFRTPLQINNPPSDFIFNEYFAFPLDNKRFLLSTRHRAWVILSKDEYALFKVGNVSANPYLFSLMHSLGFILSKHNSRQIVEVYCQRYRFLSTPPALFIVVLTNRCNLKCIYCHARTVPVTMGNENDISEELLYKTIDFFFSVPTLKDNFYLEFQGGESLLRFDLIIKGMDYAKEKAATRNLKCTFTIATNLTLMTDRIANEIKRRGDVSLCSSLDGPKIVHDSQRCTLKHSGSYDRVTYWLDRLYENYGIEVGLLPTITHRTIGHERELVDTYLRFRNRSIYVRNVNLLGRAFDESSEQISLSPQEYLKLWKNVFEYCLEKYRNGEMVVETTAKFLLQNILILQAHYMCMRKPCGCGISQVTVSSDGSIYGCDAGRSVEMLKLGHVLETTYDQLITSEGARALRTLAAECLPVCESCPFSPYCGYCVARGINQHGGPIPQIPLDFECQIYMEIIPYLFKKLMKREDAIILNQWVDS